MGEYLDAALEAAHEAEHAILEHFRTGPVVERKPDGSPVTPADKEAERIIKEVILGAYPDHGFLGEETGATNPGAAYTWIVDPIDETKNYTRRMPEFTTLIALMHGGEVIAGVSHAPLLKETFAAERGKGATMNGRAIRVSEVASLDEAYVNFGGLKQFMAEPHLARGFSSLVQAVYRPAGLSGFRAGGFLADGRLEAVLQSKISIWDIAPFALIVEEAGGQMTDLGGKPVTLSTNNALATNGLLHDAILAHFRA